MTQISAGKSTGGVLQIPAAVTQKNANPAPKKTPKPAAPRLKLLVRRLPPGLTQEEFEAALGGEWKAGAGKVDWFQYKPGKISKDPGKPSRPSRAYVHVVSSDYIPLLSDKVRRTSFLDALNTINDPVLLGPPSLEFAPFAKIPGSRVRKDARQGTIDQDPDFIAFLESLTQPITKLGPVEAAATDAVEEKKEAVTVTPLVQFIKEKKASKAKESVSPVKAAKSGKTEKESKPEKVQAKKLLQRPDKEPSPSRPTEKKTKADKATKEAVKAANKQAASVAAKSIAKPPTATTAQNTTKDATPPAPAPERKRERGNVSAAAKIVQRDLGLAPSGGRRRGGKGAAAETEPTKTESLREAATNAPSEPSKKEAAPTKPSKRSGPSQNNTKAKGNITSQPTETVPPDMGTPTASSAPRALTKPSRSRKEKQQAPAAPAVTPTATQAFLKHANPSQGVTEPLLEAAFSPFGKVLKVEIDKKKGFGYVDFAEPAGLQKAIAASPVSVAQSQVVVLERKANPGAERARGKGRAESQPSGGSSGNNARGGKGSGGGEAAAATGTGTSSAPRGPRGGRGPKNRGGGGGGGGGSKGGGGGSNTASGEKTGSK